MNYLISNEDGMVYFIDKETKSLVGTPIMQDDTFDLDEYIYIEPDHDELPKDFIEVMTRKLVK